MGPPPAAIAQGKNVDAPVPRRSYIVALLGCGSFIIGVIVLVIGWAVLQSRVDAHRTAEIATANLSKILADTLNSAIDKNDLGILAIRDEVYRQANRGRWDEEALAAAMARVEARLPDLIGFRVFGADGKLHAAVSNVAQLNADLSQRDDFKYLRDTPDSGLMVSPPVWGITTQQWVIALARRITNADGSFGGAVYGPIPIRALTRTFAALDLGPGGTVALYHDSFRMAARFPETEGPNNPVGTATISDQLRAIIGSGARIAQYDYTSSVDGVRRTATVRKIEGQPFYILVGLAEGDYLAEWRRDTARFLAFGALMVGLVLLAMAVLHRRISDWRRATIALAEKTELLIHSNADLEQFAYVASHDLQTPLRNIVSFAQLLERRYKGQLNAEADEFIGFIVDSGKRMTLLISDLLQYSRITSQIIPLHPIPAGDAVAQAMDNLKLDVDNASAEVAIGELPAVMAEQSPFVSLFQNLLGNGLKYRAPDRAPVLSVTAERIAPDRWCFAVSDNGIGIEPQYFDRIFEIFQRLDPASETKGTGIGLTLCRRIVHRFGGTIWVESIPGKGTTFFFTLKDATSV